MAGAGMGGAGGRVAGGLAPPRYANQKGEKASEGKTLAGRRQKWGASNGPASMMPFRTTLSLAIRQDPNGELGNLAADRAPDYGLWYSPAAEAGATRDARDFFKTMTGNWGNAGYLHLDSRKDHFASQF